MGLAVPLVMGPLWNDIGSCQLLKALVGATRLIGQTLRKTSASLGLHTEGRYHSETNCSRSLYSFNRDLVSHQRSNIVDPIAKDEEVSLSIIVELKERTGSWLAVPNSVPIPVHVHLLVVPLAPTSLGGTFRCFQSQPTC
jgi:hypothetical protein